MEGEKRRLDIVVDCSAIKTDRRIMPVSVFRLTAKNQSPNPRYGACQSTSVTSTPDHINVVPVKHTHGFRKRCK